MPQCMEPLQKFFDEFGEEIRSLNERLGVNPTLKGLPSPEYDNFAQRFQTDKERLVRRFFVLRAIDSEIHEKLAQFLDDLEDQVLEFCYVTAISDEVDDLEVSAVESAFWATNRNIIESMIAIHWRIF